MKNFFSFFIVILLSFFCVGFADTKICDNKNKSTPTKQEELNISQLSETLGHLVGQTLQGSGLKLDLQAFLKGMENYVANKKGEIPEESVKVLSTYIEKSLRTLAAKNLRKANEFLAQNASSSGVVELEKGKLQYLTLKNGNGNEVKSYSSPLIRYTSRDLEGFVFNSRKEELLPLDEAIEGLKKGIVGMKEGEKRLIYIHPDLGYGPKDVNLPNLLLIFEVEIIKANAITDNVNDDKFPFQGEIATPGNVR